ncbi:hypothetical protein [Streptomyces sp. NPDC051909]|uniref:hypothetical protein n=1 Tax=Streptomyces sp. NPDC051909 TaxID=3154944 RepID=UPI003449BE4E
MTSPMSDDTLKAYVRKLGRADGVSTEDDVVGMHTDELMDVADDAWFHSAWPTLENDPQFDGLDLPQIDERLHLSRVYKKAFVAAARQ